MSPVKTAMVFNLFVLVLNGILGLSPGRNEWVQWKLRHGKTYPSVHEEQGHMAIWMENYRFVQKHNSRSDVSFTVELNSLADQRISSSKQYKVDTVQRHSEDSSIVYAPASWDWRSKGAVGPVQDQGQVGDAQAIVAAECVDSFHAIHTGELVSTSSLEVHDCCTKTPIASSTVFQCIHGTGGLCSMAAYPKSLGTCGNNTCTAVATVNGGKEVPNGDEAAMMEAVYKTPVMALVDASHTSFELYESGIYEEPECKEGELDHVLQVVGYGSEGGNDYWVCKNSWGKTWGEQGYIRIARNKGNMCGIASMTTYPV